MNNHSSHSSDCIQIAVDASDPDHDPAAVRALAREIVDMLEEQGAAIEPAYTGSKGGTLYDIATQLGQNVVDNKDLLIELSGWGTAIVQYLQSRRNQQRPADPQPEPPAVIIEINGGVTTLGVNKDENKALLEQLILGTQGASANTTPRIRVVIPPAVRRPRR